MSEYIFTQMHHYFDKKIKTCEAHMKALKTAGLTDEGNFENIRRNIFDIFNTILITAEKSHKQSPDEISRFFLSKAEEIPKKWKESLEKAKANNDMEKIHIEQLKLDTINDIKTAFMAFKEASL